MRTGQDPVNTRDEEESALSGDDALLLEMRERFEISRNHWGPIHEATHADFNMVAGNGYWSAEILEEREERGLPCFVFNKLPKFCRQVTGGIKQNMPRIGTSPTEGNSPKHKNVAGTNDYTTAEVYDGIIRNIEYISQAPEHYKRAFGCCVRGGIGWLRVDINYRDAKAFDLDALISHIPDPTTVFTDPHYMQPDMSDIDYLFSLNVMPIKEYEKRYSKNLNQADSEFNYETGHYHWINGEDRAVTVAEYWYREPKTIILHKMDDGSVVDSAKKAKALEKYGRTIVNTRKRQSHVVKRLITNGHEILKESGKKKTITWPHHIIPFAPLPGTEIRLENGEIQIESLVRHSHDAARSDTYQRNAAIEMVALQPQIPYIGQEEAFEGYEDEWAEANTGRKAFLKYKRNEGGAPERQRIQDMPAAELQLALASHDDIKATTGMFDPSLGQASNETSGVAIESRKRESQESNADFYDGLQLGINKIGRICVGVIPLVYSQAKQQRIRTVTDEEDLVPINYEAQDEKGNPILIHDLGAAAYDVITVMGPSNSTARQEGREAVAKMMEVASPEIAALMMPMFARLNEFPEARQLARILENVAPAEALTDDQLQRREERLANRPQPEPTPQEVVASEIAKKQAEAEMAEAEATIIEAEAKIAEAQARGDADIEGMVNESVSKVMQSMAPNLDEAVKEAVAEALAEFIQQSNKVNNEQPKS